MPPSDSAAASLTAPTRQGRFWNNGQAFHTYLLNAISVLLPAGEAFVVQTMRDCRSAIAGPAALHAEIDGFIAEEERHSSAHGLYNARLAEQGYAIAELSAWIDKRMASLQRCSFEERMAICYALELITATLSRKLLSNPAWLVDDQSRESRLWRWHCQEEIQHVSLVGIAYKATGGKKSALWIATLLAGIWLVGDLRHIVQSFRKTDKKRGRLKTFEFGRGLVRFFAGGRHASI
ncbi:MAG: metal-dependent hydrolase [Burkholderiaceae bacterium]